MQIKKEYPILEFDPSPRALLEPSEHTDKIDMPENCVVCFFSEVIQDLCSSGKARLINSRRSEMGTHPIYEINFEEKRLAVFHPGVGAPLAASLLDEVIALGGKKFVACGGQGLSIRTWLLRTLLYRFLLLGMKVHRITILLHHAKFDLEMKELGPLRKS